ncbi:conserved hypothetical protein [Beutenbergia cavernae DSM 12333]|uniref:Htaa domain-containing protein n=1 Tax=Beutenbergia cavernae (strain ATCC BAA-8 / DSM 12333 / CCUG 43141 / JCM 11478 / NBRC 16432 / NCIMB 13614 / HKI 0122) TaxID=471853 RepID=C5C4J2_BEUC1|nr:hypothetical protein [Beutenbergia cavernae]ACQ82116.1 conserved hypothetical protein [Beutenbergia cavernae DSM 12333]
MHSTRATSRTGRRTIAGLAGLAVSLAAGVALATSAQAAPNEIDDATLRWSMSVEAGGGAFFGGCNFLSAGAAGNAGSSRLWTEADGFYQTEVGNVRVEKPTADGGWATPSWATKCQDANGAAVSTAPASTTGAQVVLSNGVGTVDAEAGTAQVSWDGDVTVVFYGGMTYWTASDPVLSVAADGTGTLTASAGGFAASMEDPSQWVPIEPVQVGLATFSGVTVTADGVEVQPDYLGVEVTTPEGASPQVRTGGSWGAFPQSYVDFHQVTGQSSYWYSSGGSADPKKPATPFTVAWTAVPGTDPGPEPGDGEVPVEVIVPEDGGPGPEPGEFSWTISGAGAVSLGTAEATQSGFVANGALHAITVTDTREDAPAWSLSGQVGAFAASGGASFGGQALGWEPALSANALGAVAGPAVAPGAGSDAGLAVSRTLVSAPAGHALGSVQVDTSLQLNAPAGTAPGAYTSTLTLTALS